MSTDHHFEQLGIKKTKAREKILEIFIKNSKKSHFFTIDEIHKICSLELKSKAMDWATVYRTIKKLEEIGFVRSTPLPRGGTGYELHDNSHPHEHHHHVHCKECKKVVSFHTCKIKKIEKEVQSLGFTDLSHQIEFYGVCNSCKK